MNQNDKMLPTILTKQLFYKVFFTIKNIKKEQFRYVITIKYEHIR